MFEFFIACSAGYIISKLIGIHNTCKEIQIIELEQAKFFKHFFENLKVSK